ncbi:discoidin domain-containing protein [Bacillus sp. J14TS2]|uniref:discoidin domain-containing protein n=1 Tax=Bacillus sp. J14TS2 TaxID=2807188 RepID=UPI001BB3AC74|nr:discoidin domain-containing protein [Bacillus sp. J14TS2]
MMIDLSGKWSYKVDIEDIGAQDDWFLAKFTDSGFQIPGSTTDNNVGTIYEFDGSLTKENIRHLRQRKQYVGKIWLKKVIEIPDFQPEKIYEFILERVMWQSELWINGQYVGSRDSLSTAHRYDITNFIASKIEIVLCIDNRDIHQINTTPSAYTEETQSIWNGMIGNCRIETHHFLFRQMKVLTNYDQQSIELTYSYESINPNAKTLYITVEKEGKVVKETTQPIYGNSGSGKLTISLPNIVSWDEFHPELYDLICTVEMNDECIACEKQRIGFRKWSTNGKQLQLNDRPAFLRGTIDCCIFPLTGYPPMDEASWSKIFQTIKEHGLNHVRFHSWCPPEAAFAVADQIGLYLQVEGPIWLDAWMPFILGDRADHYTFFQAESEAIVNTYGNHPSFCFFSCGNEIRGEFAILRKIVKSLKQMNSNILYTLTSNWDRKIDSEDDLFIAQTVDKVPVRGQYDLDKMVEETTIEFSNAIALRQVPVISHEVGQYSVYPSIREIDKYSGNLLPVNFQAIKNDLESKNMLKYADDFTYASGKLAFELYKEEIEASLRTEKMGGYQLLGLNDFTGQSTATVGLLDAFWESKNLMRVEEYRQFSAPLVPLAVMKKRIFSADETISIDLEIANYYQFLDSPKVIWSLSSETDCIFSKEFNLPKLDLGLNHITERVVFCLKNKVKQNSQMVLEVQVELEHAIKFKNSWKLWCYVKEDSVPNVIESTTITEPILKEVENGASLLLTPEKATVKEAEKTTFFPVFWSPVHFKSKDNCGLIVDNEHPLFKLFPTEKYANYQWKSLIENAFSIPFHELAESFNPMVQVVPNFFNNKKMFVLSEFVYGDGRIVVTSLNIHDESLPAIALKNALKFYMNSKQFEPANRIFKDQLASLFYAEGTQKEEIDLAELGVCTADSVYSADFAPENAINNKSSSYWKPKNNSPGHWWCIDLKAVHRIKEIEIELLSKGTYYYDVSVSEDNHKYQKLISKTISPKNSLIISDEVETSARYLRITYGDVSKGVEVGHRSVRIF